MTPQERQLIVELFERLAALERQPRDPAAERAIAEGLALAPNAVYSLVQSVLVQDEALKAANSHIEELRAQLAGNAGAAPPSGGFLDTMRDSLFGRRDEPRPGPGPQGSVPQVRQGGSPWNNTQGYQPAPPPGPGGPGMGGPGMGMGGGGGGSFLGTAAAAAAGMVGGGLLLDGIRSMLGGNHHSAAAGAFDQLSSGKTGEDASPWSGSRGSDDLARDAGLDDMGRSRFGGSEDARAASLIDDGQDDSDADYGDNFDGGGDDTDYA
jgi:hypothetical protein